jgi:hypothetical protein
VAYTPIWESLADALKRIMAIGVSENEAKLDIALKIADQKLGIRVTIAEGTCDIVGILTGAQVGVPTHLAPEDFDWANSRPNKLWPTGPRHWKSDERHSFSWRNRPISLIELRTADVIAWVETIKTTREASLVLSGVKKANDSVDKLSAKPDSDQSEQAPPVLAPAQPSGPTQTRPAERTPVQAAATAQSDAPGDPDQFQSEAAPLGDEPTRPTPGAKTRGITEAIAQLWSNGIPTGLSAKERDRAILSQMESNGSSIPKGAARAIQRVLKAQRTK